MKKVRANYFKAFDKLKDQEKVVVVDGNTNLQKVEEAILNEINKLGIKQ
jgi:thymidylate kinase